MDNNLFRKYKTGDRKTMNALSELSNLPERKEQIKEFARQGINQILNGEYSALEFKFRFDAFKKACEMILDHAAVNDLVLLEARRLDGQSYKDCKVSVQRRKTWKFDQCNDERYNEMKIVESKVKADIKKHEDALKSMVQPMADLEGNIINPPTYSEIEYITIK